MHINRICILYRWGWLQSLDRTTSKKYKLSVKLIETHSKFIEIYPKLIETHWKWIETKSKDTHWVKAPSIDRLTLTSIDYQIYVATST